MKEFQRQLDELNQNEDGSESGFPEESPVDNAPNPDDYPFK